MLALYQYDVLFEEQQLAKKKKISANGINININGNGNSTEKKPEPEQPVQDPTIPQPSPVFVNTATGRQTTVDPVNNQPVDMKTGLHIDPQTGEVIDPKQAEVQAGLASIQSVQKYVLFLKLLEFKRQLEAHNFDEHVDFKLYQECVSYVGMLITFFETFTMEQLTISINVIVDQLNKLLNVGSKIKKTKQEELEYGD